MQRLSEQEQLTILVHVFEASIPWKRDRSLEAYGGSHDVINIHPFRDHAVWVSRWRRVSKIWKSATERVFEFNHLVSDEVELRRVAELSFRKPLFRVTFRKLFNVMNFTPSNRVAFVLEVPVPRDPKWERSDKDKPILKVVFMEHVMPEYFALAVNSTLGYSKSLQGLTFLNGYPFMIPINHFIIYFNRATASFPFRVPDRSKMLYLSVEERGDVEVCMQRPDFSKFLNCITAKPKARTLSNCADLVLARDAYRDEEIKLINQKIESSFLSYSSPSWVNQGGCVEKKFYPEILQLSGYHVLWDHPMPDLLHWRRGLQTVLGKRKSDDVTAEEQAFGKSYMDRNEDALKTLINLREDEEEDENQDY